MAIILGLGLLFYILLGFRYSLGNNHKPKSRWSGRSHGISGRLGPEFWAAGYRSRV